MNSTEVDELRRALDDARDRLEDYLASYLDAVIGTAAGDLTPDEVRLDRLQYGARSAWDGLIGIAARATLPAPYAGHLQAWIDR